MMPNESLSLLPLLRRHDRALISIRRVPESKSQGLPFDVRYIQIPALAISSTNIRKRVARGMSVRAILRASPCSATFANAGYIPIWAKKILSDGGLRCR